MIPAIDQCFFFPRETERHPWSFRFWKWSRAKFRFTGGFWRNVHGQKKKFTGEIFLNDHGHFSRVTQYFWICSRAGKKFHVQLFTEMRTRQSEASTSSLSNVKSQRTLLITVRPHPIPSNKTFSRKKMVNLMFFWNPIFVHYDKYNTRVKTIEPLLDMLRISLRGIKQLQNV